MNGELIIAEFIWLLALVLRNWWLAIIGCLWLILIFRDNLVLICHIIVTRIIELFKR